MGKGKKAADEKQVTIGEEEERLLNLLAELVVEIIITETAGPAPDLPLAGSGIDDV